MMQMPTVISPISPLLLLADARFPAGGHAHSGGIEEAVERSLVADVPSLGAFLAGRLVTSGLVSAAAAAAVCERCKDYLAAGQRPALEQLWRDVDAELDARYPSPARLMASRRQGAQFLRGALTVLGGAVLESLRRHASTPPHHAVALGATAATARLHPREAAVAAAYLSVAGPASAAIRLIGLDPFEVTRAVAELTEEIDEIGITAARQAHLPLDELPMAAEPVSDLLAEAHLQRKERLFAS
jgi:urease accessory protein